MPLHSLLALLYSLKYQVRTGSFCATSNMSQLGFENEKKRIILNIDANGYAATVIAIDRIAGWTLFASDPESRFMEVLK